MESKYRARPTETSEQIVVVKALVRARIWFAAVPNGGFRPGRTGERLRREGVRRGVPDLLLFDPPPALPGFVGCALEMKRQGGVPSDVKPEQRRWLQELGKRGWATLVGYGAKDALKKLKALGYEVGSR